MSGRGRQVRAGQGRSGQSRSEGSEMRGLGRLSDDRGQEYKSWEKKNRWGLKTEETRED